MNDLPDMLMQVLRNSLHVIPLKFMSSLEVFKQILIDSSEFLVTDIFTVVFFFKICIARVNVIHKF